MLHMTAQGLPDIAWLKFWFGLVVGLFFWYFKCSFSRLYVHILAGYMDLMIGNLAWCRHFDRIYLNSYIVTWILLRGYGETPEQF